LLLVERARAVLAGFVVVLVVVKLGTCSRVVVSLSFPLSVLAASSSEDEETREYGREATERGEFLGEMFSDVE
jgi:hypothetical protein